MIVRRLPLEELFYITPEGLEPIGDETLNRRIDEAELRLINLSQLAPLETV